MQGAGERKIAGSGCSADLGDSQPASFMSSAALVEERQQEALTLSVPPVFTTKSARGHFAFSASPLCGFYEGVAWIIRDIRKRPWTLPDGSDTAQSFERVAFSREWASKIGCLRGCS